MINEKPQKEKDFEETTELYRAFNSSLSTKQRRLWNMYYVTLYHHVDYIRDRSRILEGDLGKMINALYDAIRCLPMFIKKGEIQYGGSIRSVIQETEDDQ